MPVLQPAEIWEKTGRYEIDELFKLEDRKGSPLVLAMTHEEAVTYHVAREVRSYRDLPLMLYHLQTKERDEPRPRAGVLRTREFTMKDAYSFDRDEEGLDALLRAAGGRLRADLRPLRPALVPGRVRRRDDGRLRRPRVHGALPGGRERGRAGARLRRQRRGRLGRAAAGRAAGAAATRRARSTTPGLTTVEEVAGALGVPAGRADQGDADRSSRAAGWSSSCSAATTASTRSSCATRSATDFRQAQRRGDRGASSARSASSGRSAPSVPIIKDAAISGDSYVSGANEPDAHLRGVDPGRDFESYEMDVRTVEAGDTAPGGGTIEIEPAIEVGNIFKLGTRYSEPLGATYLDEDGNEQPIVMGSYGIGPARIVAAAIEQRADERGIVWPRVDRALAGPPRLARRRRARTSARPPTGSTRSCARAGAEVALRRPRRRARGEADRRRAARLPAADRRRPARPRRGRRRGAASAPAAPRTSCPSRTPPQRALALLEGIDG